MRNVTVVLDDEVAQWVRIEAARHDLSMSRYIGDLLRNQMTDDMAYERAQRSYLDRPAVLLSDGSPYPSRDEVHRR